MLQARFSTWTPLPGDDVFGDRLPTIFGTCGPGDRWGWCVEIPLPNRVGDNPPDFRGRVKREVAIAAVPGGAGWSVGGDASRGAQPDGDEPHQGDHARGDDHL